MRLRLTKEPLEKGPSLSQRFLKRTWEWIVLIGQLLSVLPLTIWHLHNMAWDEIKRHCDDSCDGLVAFLFCVWSIVCIIAGGSTMFVYAPVRDFMLVSGPIAICGMITILTAFMCLCSVIGIMRHFICSEEFGTSIIGKQVLLLAMWFNLSYYTAIMVYVVWLPINLLLTL